MSNVWTEWQKMWRAGAMLSETMTASQAVVGHRSRTIEDAMSDPLRADYGELNRMVSEKATAFGAAGMSLSRDWLAMQRDWGAQVSDMSAMMFGKLPSPQKAQAMVNRSQRLGSAALASSVRAMTPIHR
ncbi:MAG: hypothetical protein ABIR87_00015, partial [Sphingomicrobium sp.]